MFFTRKAQSNAAVILKRQVPVRFDKPARSWLGGLPQMPQDIPWPYSTDGSPTPLHFLAQIACADLPKGIWHGAGPHKGWLLLFAETKKFNNNGILRVLHVKRLGPEREPPGDMPTVRHTMSDYIDYDRHVIREGVPKMWRRWPVDLVVEQIPDDEPLVEPPDIKGAELYGAPEDAEDLIWLAEAKIAGGTRPLTWRGVLYYLDGTLRGLDRQEVRSKFVAREGLAGDPGWGDGWLETARETISAKRAEDATKLAQSEDELRNLSPDATDSERSRVDMTISGNRSSILRLDQLLADIAPFAGPTAEADLAAEIVRAANAYLTAVEKQLAAMHEARSNILARNLDEPIGVEDWARIDMLTQDQPVDYWARERYLKTVYRTRRNRVIENRWASFKMAVREDLLDLYTRDAASRALIPPELLAKLEPKLRHIYECPHRIGGRRRSLQEGATEDDDPLIFMLESDPAMGWMWGDAGILLVYLKPEHLKAGRFDQVYGWVEGH